MPLVLLEVCLKIVKFHRQCVFSALAVVEIIPDGKNVPSDHFVVRCSKTTGWIPAPRIPSSMNSPWYASISSHAGSGCHSALTISCRPSSIFSSFIDKPMRYPQLTQSHPVGGCEKGFGDGIAAHHLGTVDACRQRRCAVLLGKEQGFLLTGHARSFNRESEDPCRRCVPDPIRYDELTVTFSAHLPDSMKWAAISSTRLLPHHAGTVL